MAAINDNATMTTFRSTLKINYQSVLEELNVQLEEITNQTVKKHRSDVLSVETLVTTKESSERDQEKINKNEQAASKTRARTHTSWLAY